MAEPSSEARVRSRGRAADVLRHALALDQHHREVDGPVGEAALRGLLVEGGGRRAGPWARRSPCSITRPRLVAARRSPRADGVAIEADRLGQVALGVGGAGEERGVVRHLRVRRGRLAAGLHRRGGVLAQPGEGHAGGVGRRVALMGGEALADEPGRDVRVVGRRQVGEQLRATSAWAPSGLCRR